MILSACSPCFRDVLSRNPHQNQSMASLQLEGDMQRYGGALAGLGAMWGEGEWDWSAIIVRNLKLFMDLLYLLSTFLGHSFVYKTVFTLMLLCWLNNNGRFQ